MRASYACALREFGGLDILVSNAGIASAAPIEDTTLELWNRNMGILATGYFLVAREAFALLKRQGTSAARSSSSAARTRSRPRPGASAYCTAKAAELHLARCLALEGRRGRDPRQRRQPRRGAARLEDLGRRAGARSAPPPTASPTRSSRSFYRKRCLLKRSVLPEDIAEAVYFFASELSAKSTGNILNVDAGNVTAFTR